MLCLNIFVSSGVEGAEVQSNDGVNDGEERVDDDKEQCIESVLPKGPMQNLKFKMEKGPQGEDGIYVLLPTLEQWNDRDQIFETILQNGIWSKYGMLKIKAPVGGIPEKNWEEEVGNEVLEPLLQELKSVKHVKAAKKKPKSDVEGLFIHTILGGGEESQTVADFIKKMRDSNTLDGPGDPKEAVAQYWEAMTKQKGVKQYYGADIDFEVFGEDHPWSFTNFKGCVVREMMQERYEPKKIEGITSGFVYIGTYMSSFSIHTEDEDLYSINVVLQGRPKFWICVRPGSTRKFEE